MLNQKRESTLEPLFFTILDHTPSDIQNKTCLEYEQNGCTGLDSTERSVVSECCDCPESTTTTLRIVTDGGGYTSTSDQMCNTKSDGTCECSDVTDRFTKSVGTNS